MHYFSENPDSKHDESTISGMLRGKRFSFKTDSGVFSPKKIDKGTIILVEELEVSKDDDVLDVGCGYGVIGISIADEVNSVTMTDLNNRSVGLTRKNIKLNGKSEKNIEVFQGDLFEKVNNKKYSVIISNPPIKAGKDLIHKIISKGHDLLNENGSIWVVIQTKHGAKSLAKYMEEIFGNVETVTISGGYRVLKSLNVRKE
ncbi:16S rRNA (guanine1207-N2)-methyltransferase [Methanococcus maripaludis]|uniref:16S rRNA (Guanine1207-N2)-methyltransferase n=1 Tax=Methanococcus maripaludis TaxID=39152 RepID=A0A2L1C8Y6_METMI|nr:class I SAM-dependent methyltransferase [Methanococcus maripaludis]AVB75848.1 Ribosomal RNA small subunit methyltransferase C [Methanococcus maripaludis]MBA2841074.1 16S rRNA (guanine1207-N2)-methyltransferase [Methanococcus maripaludis]MBA2864265.1 16S rRNA (guanine1207-N2)-methyltransferase [Methanococcus maripaludis]MBB6497191.1 16S rRNA (guanine1207-N2)-methyltransferase [Methanococcus maripaludis]